MSYKCHVLGTGSMGAVVNYYNTNLMLDIEGGKLLLDCGFTIQQALDNQGYSLSEIDAAYITHVHGDHAYGVEQLAYNAMFTNPRRVTLYVEKGIESVLWDECLQGSLKSTGRGAHTFDDYFDITIVDDHQFRFRGCEFETFATHHTAGKSTYGVIVDQKLVYTSDTKPLCWLKYAGEKFDYIIHDCSPSGEAAAVHASYKRIMDCYPESVRKRIKAIHYDKRIEDIRSELEGAQIGIAEQGDIYEF